MERIDKILSNAGLLSRKESREAAKKGRIRLNGAVIKSSDAKITDDDLLELDGVPVNRQRYYYIMMNKPDGLICSTDDPSDTTVMSLIAKEDYRRGMFPVGRLDKHTVGLLIISNDGILAHELLSPKKHVEKSYFFKLEKDFDPTYAPVIEAGISLDGGETAKPARLCMQSQRSGVITVTEGKFHLVKRIFEAAQNKVVYLRRMTFGPLALDENLAEGEYRFLTPEEVECIKKVHIK